VRHWFWIVQTALVCAEFVCGLLLLLLLPERSPIRCASPPHTHQRFARSRTKTKIEHEPSTNHRHTQLSEALENLYRRPEDHNSFEQNVEATAAHAAVPVRAVDVAGAS
jgi:hypothetical protein